MIPSVTRAPGRATKPGLPANGAPRFIKWFADITIDDVPLVGGKNASLGEMYRELTSKGVKVPNGFAVTAEAYRYFLREVGLDAKIRCILTGLDTGDMENLRQRGAQIRQAILAAELPCDLEQEITAAYDAFRGNGLRPVDVAVRSSATAEDLPDASFAGQQETYLNVCGHLALLDCCKRSFASLFTDRAISYRTDKKFDHFKVALSIGVQLMVRSDLAASGVMFTLDTETGFRDAVLINAAYGLGENVVQGSVNPDEYYVFKPTLKTGHKPILQKIVGTKEFKLIYEIGGGKMVKNVPVSSGDRLKFAITDDEILQLARWACLIEDHYSARRGQSVPMDIEWAKDGHTGEMFIVQARPETVQSRKAVEVMELYVMCEIPSNVILAEEFAEIFDGFSIGSNDLTQLILGVDRDSEIVASIFDERNPAVKKMIAQVIAVCRAKKRKIGICGQAPSDYPEFAEFLVEQGIDSISLNPDTVMKTTLAILEKELGLKR